MSTTKARVYQPIEAFVGPYRFLSNFHPAQVEVIDESMSRWVLYQTVENAYQAAKTLDPNERFRISMATPGMAKRLGRTATLRPGWDDMKVKVMKTLLRVKFQHADLGQLLLSTGDAMLYEGNPWGDRYWGVFPVGSRKGENMLGKLLMEIRDELQNPLELIK